MSTTKHEITKIKEYTDKGYTSNYRVEDGKLRDLENDILLDASEIIIDDEFRYEGISNPSDMSIFYAIRVPEKSKGTMVVPYGPTGNTSLAEFMKDVSLNEHNQDKSTLNKV